MKCWNKESLKQQVAYNDYAVIYTGRIGHESIVLMFVYAHTTKK